MLHVFKLSLSLSLWLPLCQWWSLFSHPPISPWLCQRRVSDPPMVSLFSTGGKDDLLFCFMVSLVSLQMNFARYSNLQEEGRAKPGYDEVGLPQIHQFYSWPLAWKANVSSLLSAVRRIHSEFPRSEALYLQMDSEGRPSSSRLPLPR